MSLGEFIRDRLPDAAEYFDLEGVPLKGPGRWKTGPCHFHGGSDSLRVNVRSGGWCCMNCGTKGGDVLAYAMQRHGMEFIDAAKALGAWDEATPRGSAPHKPRAFSARAAVEVLRFESLLVATAACNLAKGIALSDADRKRLVEAAGRILSLTQEFGT